MATKTIFVLLFTFQCFLRSQTSTNMLDFIELHDVNYGIDIAANPVVLGEESLSNNMYLTSIYGQQYQCSIPDPIGDEEKTKEEEKVAMETGIVELLKPMTEAVCLVHTKDWWTYELCYGKYIKQFHKEDGKVSGAVTMLGYFQSDFDWTNETAEKSRNRHGRYHSQEYTNGSSCDLTGKPRQAQVRYLCEVGHGDYISRIEEPSTCVYNIIVHTPKLCTHPYLKARAPKRPVQITCNPILSADEFQEYQEYQEEKRQEEEAFRAYQKQLQVEREEALLAQQKKAEEDRQAKLEAEQSVRVAEAEPDEEGFVSDEVSEDADELVDYEQEVDMAVSVLQNLFSESLAQGLQEIFEKEGYLDKIIPPNIDAKAYKETKHSQTQDASESKDSTLKFESQHRTPNTRRRLSDDEIKEKFPSIDLQGRVVYEETDRNGRRLWTLETDLEANDDPETLEWSELEMEEGFHAEDIDFGEDAAEDFDKFDDELMEEYEKELDAIKAGHKSARSSLAKYKETIESALKAKFPDIVEEAEQELGLDESEIITREEAFSAMAKSLTKLLNKLDDPDPDPGEDEDPLESEEDDLQPHPQESEAKTDVADDRVRVRLTRVAQVDEEDEDAETDPAKLPGEIQIPEEQKAKLETQMKAELQKAGMDTEGRKIEVKIITAGYIDGDDTLHILSDDESSAFNNMIVTILQGSTEADKEAKHQSVMEDNYRFQWGDNKKSKKPIL